MLAEEISDLQFFWRGKINSILLKLHFELPSFQCPENSLLFQQLKKCAQPTLLSQQHAQPPLFSPVERVADGEVPLQGDGAGEVDGPREADLGQGEDEGEGVRVGQGRVEAGGELGQGEDEGGHGDVGLEVKKRSFSPT